MHFLFEEAIFTKNFDVNADKHKKVPQNTAPLNKPFLPKTSIFLYSFIFLQKIFKKIFPSKLLIINAFWILFQKIFKKTSQNIWSVLKKPVPLHSQIRNNAYHTNKNGDEKALKMSAKHDLWQ